MIRTLWHRAMVAIGVRAPAQLRWTPGAAELFCAEMNAAVERSVRQAEIIRLQAELLGPDESKGSPR